MTSSNTLGQLLGTRICESNFTWFLHFLHATWTFGNVLSMSLFHGSKRWCWLYLVIDYAVLCSLRRIVQHPNASCFHANITWCFFWGFIMVYIYLMSLYGKSSIPPNFLPIPSETIEPEPLRKTGFVQNHMAYPGP